MIGNTIVLKTRFQCTSMCPSYWRCF
jgi:hypothetical protein